MIKSTPICCKLFELKFRDMLRIAAGLELITVIRKKHTVHLAVDQSIRRCIDALHLVINYAVTAKLPVLIFQFIMPSFLKKRLLLRHTERMKHRVQIDVHKIQEILVIPAAHRIHGLIRKCERIHEGL